MPFLMPSSSSLSVASGRNFFKLAVSHLLPPADPNSWYIKDGKLYFLLFYGLWDWLETEPGGIDQSLAIASGRWRQCFGDIFETNFMFDGVISDLYQGTCEMRDGSAPLQKGDDDSALPY